jgi:hypothetical protein
MDTYTNKKTRKTQMTETDEMKFHRSIAGYTINQGCPHYSGYMCSGASTNMIIIFNLFQWFSNCGMRTTGGTWSILRWYAIQAL